MSFAFSPNSQKNLLTCHSKLQVTLNTAIRIYDFSVVYGYRDEETQNQAYNLGKSELKFPNSKHNKNPAEAFDIYPYHVLYGSLTEDSVVINKIKEATGLPRTAVLSFIREEYCLMAGVILAVAKLDGVKLRWGGDWNSDTNRLDNTFNDLAHFELI
jgi:peptidoglycan L-alanyl-D-glutamate endopeptidase CwlK